MKINTSNIILVLVLLFFGLTDTQAAYNDDCLLDVFYTELKEKNSDKVYDYFLNKSEEDCNRAYEAWKVLYQADENAERLNIDNIETVYTYMISTEKTVDEVVAEISYVNGFNIWKNLEYQFQKEGYKYVPNLVRDDRGYIRIYHKLEKNGVFKEIGDSRITPGGTLYNILEIPEGLQRKGISKAIYKRVLQEDMKEISSYYMDEDGFADNLKAFMNVYNTTKDAEKAAMATPQGKVLGNLWKPVNIKVINGEVHLTWVKRGGSNEVKNSLIKELLIYTDASYKGALQKDLEASEDLVKLFQENPEFISSWQKLVDFPNLRTDMSVLKTYGKVKRIGNYSEKVIPVKTSELTQMHPAPKYGKEAEFLSLKNNLANNGYDLSTPIQAVELPDGAILVIDGNHRLKAMKELEQKIIPANILNINEAIQIYGKKAYLKRLENLKKSGGDTTVNNTSALLQSLGEESMAVSIEVARLIGNYSGTYVQRISGTEMSQEEIQALARLFLNQNFPGWDN